MNNNILDDCPKQLCSGASFGHSKEIFMLVLNIGKENIGFAITPTLMKAMVNVFNQGLSSYEEKNGKIENTQNEVISPFSVSDIKGL